MPKNPIKIENITLIGQTSKNQMLRVINERDYEGENTDTGGLLFGLIDISLTQSQNIKMFDILNEGISRYYKNDLDYDIAYDDMINFLNRRTSQFIPTKNLKGNANLVMGVLKNKKLLFCISGNMHAYLVYPQGVKKIFPEEKENTLDVSEKLFSYSLNGEIQKGYTLYFCNEEFNNVVNPYQLGNFIKEQGTDIIIKDLKDWLLHNQSNKQFNALFLYYPNKTESPGSAHSIEDLFKKEEKILQEMSPTLINSIRKSLKDRSILSYIFNFIVKALKIIKKGLLFTAFLLFNTFFIITNLRGKRKEKQLIVNSRFKNIGIKIADFYRALTGVSKAILISIIGLGLILAGGISYSLHLQKVKQLKLAYSKKIETAENLYDQAESDLLFQEKNIAVKKLKDALVVLDEIPKKIQDEKYNSLYYKTKEKLYKIQNISEVSSPVVIADFSLEENIEFLPPIYIEGGKINLFTKNENITIDLNNQVINKSRFTVKGLDKGRYYYHEESKSLYSLENAKTLQISTPGTLQSQIKEITLHTNEEDIEQFAVFNKRLYAASVNTKHFSIWKHNPSLAGFGRPTLWASDNMPIGEKILSLGIDGDIYILFSNNDIYKFYRGIKQAWSYTTDGIDGNLKFKKLLTGDNYSYIYLLGDDRISVISKNGDFLAHYLLSSITNIQDMAVDEDEEIIYVLADKKIYSFSYSL